MRRVVVALFLTLYCAILGLYAQGSGVLQGVVTDGRSEPIIGATITFKESPNRGGVTDLEGGYSIAMPNGRYSVVAQYMGYTTYTKSIEIEGRTTLNIEMYPASTELGEVVVSANSPLEKLKSVQIGIERVDIKSLSKVPALFGENDIIKSITLLPGVKSEGDGSSGFQVRGGTSSQNLILLDDAPIYNSGHVLGIFSVFNDDALAGADLYKGQIPAQFGGATSSVLDIQTKNASKQEATFGADIGLLSTKAFVEVPIVEDKLSVFASARRSYFDMFLKLTDDYEGNKLYFYDINAKLNYRISDNDILSLSYFKGEDMMGLKDMMTMKWGNDALTAKWFHRYNEQLNANTTLTASNYGSDNGIDVLDIDASYTGFIRNYSLRHNFNYTPNEYHSLKFGFQSTYIDLKSAEWQYNEIQQKEQRQGWENSLWVNEQWKISPRFDLSVGLRLNSFTALGGSPYYLLDEYGDIEETLNYDKGEFVQSYIQTEPRLSLNWRIDQLQSLKAGYSSSSQNIHALRNSTMSMPFDRYAMSSNLIKPQHAHQFALGYMALSSDHVYEFSVEGYYKKINNIYDYKEGKSFNSEIELERILLGGEGRAYGVEFSARKSVGQLTGWVGYTLSWVENRIDGINNNQWYTASNDKRHDITAVAMYTLPKGWSAAANFVYNTGQALTAPSAKYEIDGETLYYYAERNGYRAPNYHRLDLSFTHTKTQKHYTREWAIGFYNLYNRYNPYMVYFENDETKPSGTRTVQYSLFGIIPSLSYGITF